MVSTRLPAPGTSPPMGPHPGHRNFGLAVGVGLVLGIIRSVPGPERGADGVLQPLSSIGTDILVTPGGNVDRDEQRGAEQPAERRPAEQRRRRRWLLRRQHRTQCRECQRRECAPRENSNVTTDLSKIGSAGTKFTHDFFLSSTLLSFPGDALTATVTVPGVASATAGLTQLRRTPDMHRADPDRHVRHRR